MGIEGFNNNKSGRTFPGEPLSAKSINSISSNSDRANITYGDAQTIQGPFGTVFMAQNEVVNESDILIYPFKVNVYKKDPKDNFYVASLLPGTANNVIPKIGSKYLDDDESPYVTLQDGKNYVCLKVIYGTTPTFFPDGAEIVAIQNINEMKNTNEFGFLNLASVNVKTSTEGEKSFILNQYIFSSQIIVRAKAGNEIATWAFNSR